MKDETLIRHLKYLIAICDEPLNRVEMGLPWEPLRRGDTYLLRNTLRSIVEIKER